VAVGFFFAVDLAKKEIKMGIVKIQNSRSNGVFFLPWRKKGNIFFGSWSASLKGQFSGEHRKEAGRGMPHITTAMPLVLSLPPPLSAITTCMLK